MTKIAVLGSTGSIGTQTLDIVSKNEDLQVAGLAAGKNIELLEQQIRTFKPRLAAVGDPALAKELAPSNIQVNAVACGAIDTEMNQWMEEDDLITLVDEIPAGRLGRAEEVADLVYHLGYKNAYLTGQVIGLDGGWI